MRYLLAFTNLRYLLIRMYVHVPSNIFLLRFPKRQSDIIQNYISKLNLLNEIGIIYRRKVKVQKSTKNVPPANYQARRAIQEVFLIFQFPIDRNKHTLVRHPH